MGHGLTIRDTVTVEDTIFWPIELSVCRASQDIVARAEAAGLLPGGRSELEPEVVRRHGKMGFAMDQFGTTDEIIVDGVGCIA